MSIFLKGQYSCIELQTMFKGSVNQEKSLKLDMFLVRSVHELEEDGDVLLLVDVGGELVEVQLNPAHLLNNLTTC